MFRESPFNQPIGRAGGCRGSVSNMTRLCSTGPHLGHSTNRSETGMYLQLPTWVVCFGSLHSTNRSATGTSPQLRIWKDCSSWRLPLINRSGIGTSRRSRIWKVCSAIDTPFNQADRQTGTNPPSVTNMVGMFSETNSLSLANRKKIHAAFSSNPNWTYEWSTFYRPLPQLLSAQTGSDLNYTFNGKILATGGMPVTGVAFELADNMLFQKAQTHPASLAASNFSVSLILEGGKRYYYRAVATNWLMKDGTTRLQSTQTERLVTPDSKTYWWSDSSPQAGGWRTSPWFGNFRPHESGWVYHLKLGWAYAHPDGSGGLWLWMKDHGWLWTRDGAYPYFWKNADGSWQYLLGTQNGQPVFQEWLRASSASKP